jgi:hypothetical protein
LGTFYGHLVILDSFDMFFPGFGILHQEKSGNPAVCTRDVLAPISNRKPVARSKEDH